MKPSGIIRSLLLLLSLLLALVPLSASRATAASPPTFNPPKQFYLALGDSLAFGFQLDKYLAEFPNVDPATFNTGYVDDFAAKLATVHPSIQTVNYGCPGATTATFISVEGCSTYPFRLHTSFSGTQLDAAVSFINAHPNQVNPITIDIGANDVLLDLLLPCFKSMNPPLCVSTGLPGVLLSVGRNLGAILSALRAAAPHSEIIVMQYYNPFAVLDPTTTTDTVVVAGNAVIAAAANQQQALLANAFIPFNVAPPDSLTLCDLGPFCPFQDIHPSDRGYSVIADQFWAASGYDRLGS